jgi:DNA helicase-2/ATP-dependent DNA helicase PcrA
MQWDMAKTIWDKSENNYIAGDDDQAIFKWAGADVNRFITLGGKYIKLTQSYRIPAKVHEFAMKIINKVGNRIPKNWKPRTVEGSLSTYADFRHIDMSKGEWLVLARTRSMLDELEDIVYKNGLYYKNKFKKSYEQDLYDAINDWEHLRQGQLLNYKQIEKIYSYMSKNNVEKNKLKIMIKDAFFGIDQLSNQYGLKTKNVWYEAFDNAPSKKVSYIRQMRKNGEQLNKKPRIILSTIHGVKGGEADNVVLLTDLSRQTLREYERVPDDVNRLFYVGATRTKEHLHIVEPKDIYKAFRI